MRRFIGVDLHKRVAQIHILDEKGRDLLLDRIEVTRQSLLDFAEKHFEPTDTVVFEATTNSWAVCDLWEPFVDQVVVSNPMQTKAIACAKVKTDKVDARILAELMRCDFLPRVWQPDPVTRRMRRLTNRRASMIADRTAIKNRIHASLAMKLLACPERLFSGKGQAWLKALKLDEDTDQAVQSDLRLLAQLEKEIDALDHIIARQAYSQEDVKLLMTLPGVSTVVAVALVAAWGDIRRFKTASQAAAYLGLVPSVKQSANTCYYGPITKRGQSRARWLLVQAAQCLSRHPGPHGHFFRKLAKKKNRNIAVVATARKLATIAFLILKNREPYRYANPVTTQNKLARIRIIATGKKRASGNPKGSSRPKNYGSGLQTRAVPSLNQVLGGEGLPLSKTTVTPGEQRVLAETASQQHFAEVHTQQRRKKVQSRQSPAPC